MVVTFHPSLSGLNNTIKKLLPLLYTDDRVKNVFSAKPFISFRSVRNLKAQLVRAKVYPLDRVKGLDGCGARNCKTCLNVQKTNTFKSMRPEKPSTLTTDWVAGTSV